MNVTHNKLIYVFCVTREDPLLINHDVKDEILSIEIDGFYATIKYASENEFSEENIKKNISNVAWLDANVREHLKHISAIMQSVTVIPFNFGTLYKSEDGLRQFIRNYAKEFEEGLQYLENKEEWAVKAVCDKKKVIGSIGSLSQNISDIDQQIKDSSPGKAYILGKKKNEIIEKEINSIYNSISKLIFNRLNGLCEEFSINVIVPDELREKDQDMILNVAFLIRKENIENFIQLSDKLITEYENIGLTLDLTGPWPPYTFINILK
jgi:hypothetical protein